jgi:hypothetical protein
MNHTAGLNELDLSVSSWAVEIILVASHVTHLLQSISVWVNEILIRNQTPAALLTNLGSKAGHNLASCHNCGDEKVNLVYKKRCQQIFVGLLCHLAIKKPCIFLLILKSKYNDVTETFVCSLSFVQAATHVYIGGSAIRPEALISTGAVSLSSWTTLPNSSLSSSPWNQEKNQAPRPRCTDIGSRHWHWGSCS